MCTEAFFDQRSLSEVGSEGVTLVWCAKIIKFVLIFGIEEIHHFFS